MEAPDGAQKPASQCKFLQAAPLGHGPRDPSLAGIYGACPFGGLPPPVGSQATTGPSGSASIPGLNGKSLTSSAMTQKGLLRALEAAVTGFASGGGGQGGSGGHFYSGRVPFC